MTETNGQIRALRQRWERLEEDKKAISEDLKELFGEAKACGYDPKALRLAFRTLAKDENESEADKATRETAELYMAALLGEPSRTQARDAREERSKERLSEAMADHKEMSAELAAAGLISPEAHAENIALADGVASKLGAGIRQPGDDFTFNIRKPDGSVAQTTWGEHKARLARQAGAAA